MDCWLQPVAPWGSTHYLHFPATLLCGRPRKAGPTRDVLRSGRGQGEATTSLTHRDQEVSNDPWVTQVGGWSCWRWWGP